MAFGAMAIQSPANPKQYGGGGDLRTNPVGTSLYVLKDWVRDDHITLGSQPQNTGVSLLLSPPS